MLCCVSQLLRLQFYIADHLLLCNVICSTERNDSQSYITGGGICLNIGVERDLCCKSSKVISVGVITTAGIAFICNSSCCAIFTSTVLVLLLIHYIPDFVSPPVCVHVTTKLIMKVFGILTVNKRPFVALRLRVRNASQA